VENKESVKLQAFAAPEYFFTFMPAVHLLCIILYLLVESGTNLGHLRGVITSCEFEEGLLISHLFWKPRDILTLGNT
jgi:hypothetical protein